MSRHRLERAPRVRPRFGRMAAAALSLAVTMVALLGGLGVLPLQPGDDAATVASSTKDPSADADASAAVEGAGAAGVTLEPPGSSRSQDGRTVVGAPEGVAEPVTDDGRSTTLPANSGSGRRVVFSKSAQRVWLVKDGESVASTYLVSGSVTNNLGPGTYSVYSRARWAVGIEDSGVMQYFVRFAHGPNAAIGFHSIPTKNGTPLQTVAQLGTPQSHGCIRQRLSDAVRMWEFADVGTTVVVIA